MRFAVAFAACFFVTSSARADKRDLERYLSSCMTGNASHARVRSVGWDGGDETGALDFTVELTHRHTHKKKYKVWGKRVASVKVDAYSIKTVKDFHLNSDAIKANDSKRFNEERGLFTDKFRAGLAAQAFLR